MARVSAAPPPPLHPMCSGFKARGRARALLCLLDEGEGGIQRKGFDQGAARSLLPACCACRLTATPGSACSHGKGAGGQALGRQR